MTRPQCCQLGSGARRGGGASTWGTFRPINKVERSLASGHLAVVKNRAESLPSFVILAVLCD
jgi:hypothetical protein